MRIAKIGRHTVEIYDNIEELPMRRFHKYNKMLLIDAGIGSDIADFDNHIQKAMMYARSKSPELAAVELENMRQNVYFIQSGLSPRHLAFAALVKSIDGKLHDDISDDALQKIVELFADVPVKDVAAQIEAVKKKIDEELQAYFPHLFESGEVKEYYDELRRRTLVVLDSIINGDSEAKRAEIDRLTMELLLYNKPQSFTGADNFEVSYDKQFDRMCFVLSQQLNIPAESYTVRAFYGAFEYLKEQARKRDEVSKRNK